ncbi:MAG TPA: TetR family transcriptional regulator [Ktedonobacterales bacterium]|jgi:TetR/AcrR family acrAB operon transcriptional repressor
MARKTKEEAAATRQALLDAALIVFSQKGYAAARLEEIAENAGVSRGAIYWHFGSKAELYSILVDETMGRIQGVVDRAVSGGGSWLDIQRRVMIYIITLLEEDETYRAVQELTILKTGLAPELGEGMRKKQEAMRQLEEEIAGYYREGIALGEVRANLDPVIAARAMLAYLNGVSLNWLLDQQAFSLRESAPALVDVFMYDIAARPA